jgi:hypothetical protein
MELKTPPIWRIVIMRTLAFLILLVFVTFANAQSDESAASNKDWKWIQLLKTSRQEIETIYGPSVSRDASSWSQVYEAEFGRIGVFFALKERFVEACRCEVPGGTVLSIFISPDELYFDELDFDMGQFRRDPTYSPREIGYLNVKLGIFLSTTLETTENKQKRERVLGIWYRPVSRDQD